MDGISLFTNPPCEMFKVLNVHRNCSALTPNTTAESEKGSQPSFFLYVFSTSGSHQGLLNTVGSGFLSEISGHLWA